MSYLKHKPGSIEELMANEASKLNDNAYQQMFKKELFQMILILLEVLIT